jgi:chromosome segregation ATPase
VANPETIATKDAVFEIASRLKGEDVAPTNRKILHELGGGSMKTIAAYLREWKAQQAIQAPARTDAVEIPQVVLEALNQAGLIIWAAATAEIRREIEAVTEQANQRVKESETERDSVLTELSEAETELQDLRLQAGQEQARLTGDIESLTSQIERLTAQLAEANRVASAEAARASELEKQVADTRSERDRLHGELDVERKRLDQLEEQHRQELAQLRQSASEESTRLRGEMTEQKKRAADEIARCSERAQRAEGEALSARKEAASARENAAKCQGEIEAVRSQNKELLRTLTTGSGGKTGK